MQTDRLRVHFLSCGDERNPPLVFLHGNLSSATFFEELMLAFGGRMWCIAPDIRGFGHTESLPIDATRGLRDLSDDLASFLNALGIAATHLLGWSAGAGVILQFAIDRADRCRSLTLIAPVSPYGFAGSLDEAGTVRSPDCAGSGGGIVSAEFIAQLQLADPGSESEHSARNLLRTAFTNPPCRLRREEALIDAIHTTQVGDDFYPGDYEYCDAWPGVAPGERGIINALSPKYFNTSSIVSIAPKPPILWLRGDADVIVSDRSLFDPATHFNSETSGEDRAPTPQPMIRQTRKVLRDYERNGGYFREVVFSGAGHSPFLESPDTFVPVLHRFLDDRDRAQRARSAGSS